MARDMMGQYNVMEWDGTGWHGMGWSGTERDRLD